MKKDITKFKLGVGPMSHEIIELINEYGETTPLMIVASRNQVDYDSGYVCKTSELARLTSEHIMLCRDHCGPYFSDRDKSLTLSEALDECKKTIHRDINRGFDLIHIDVSRITHHQFEYAKELIDFALEQNPNIMLEFGSEDNTGEGLGPSMSRVDAQLHFISQYNNVKFFVTQTGSFTQHMQMGHFDIDFNTHICKRIHHNGFMFKEHNADYLTRSEVEKRRAVGVDALNIAPQLGTVQTRILKELVGPYNKEWYEFSKRVVDSNLWTKWLPRDVNNPELAVIVAGHYHFNSIEYKRLLKTIDINEFREKLRIEIFNVFDTYTKDQYELV